jgi:hypothetical protein
MKEEKIQKEMMMLKNLKQFKDKPLSEIKRRAIVNVEIREFLKLNSVVRDEKRFATVKMKKYINEFNLADGDYDNLKQDLIQEIVYAEILRYRIKKKIGQFIAADGKEGLFWQCLEALFRLDDRILELKKELGKHLIKTN